MEVNRYRMTISQAGICVIALDTNETNKWNRKMDVLVCSDVRS